ncbi:hypothetical protein [Ferrimonas balearica]|uniref:hypothetical protein n=1 Tax=Ferrimonas balearica TaxID=44012 RepID=UPI001C9A1846|nr:hypothetical protein [Ferrimonas balearica]MBY5993042.1 hypothetical protein [Ferrimonas balearica]
MISGVGPAPLPATPVRENKDAALAVVAHQQQQAVVDAYLLGAGKQDEAGQFQTVQGFVDSVHRAQAAEAYARHHEARPTPTPLERRYQGESETSGTLLATSA